MPVTDRRISHGQLDLVQVGRIRHVHSLRKSLVPRRRYVLRRPRR